MGSVTRACSSSKAGSGVEGHARLPAACGQGELPLAQLTHPVAVGTPAEATAAASLGPIAVGWPTVKTVALRIVLVSNFAAAAQSRSGWYLGHCAARAVSVGAVVARRAERSAGTWISCSSSRGRPSS